MLQINACRVQPRRTTLQVIRQSWIGGWSASIFAPPAGCTDQFSRVDFQCPEISPVKQLLADVDEHEVGVYSTVGR